MDYKYISAFKIFFRLFLYYFLPLKLYSIPIKFPKLMHKILQANLDIFCIIYLDGFFIFS